MADVPIVTWTNASNTEQVNMWELETVEAGNDPASTLSTFLIWNNKGGATAVPNMTNTVITTKDTGGNMNIPLVRERWVQVRCDSLGDSTFTAIGASNSTGELKQQVQGQGQEKFLVQKMMGQWVIRKTIFHKLVYVSLFQLSLLLVT